MNMEKVRIVNATTGQAKYVSSFTAKNTIQLKSMGWIVQDLPKKLELEKEVQPILDEPKNEAKPRKTRTTHSAKKTD